MSSNVIGREEGLGRGIPPGLGYPQSHHLAPVGGDDGETPTLPLPNLHSMKAVECEVRRN